MIDVMGVDTSILQAASIYYGEGTKTISDGDHLMRYRTRHQHTSPFARRELKLHWCAPTGTWPHLICE